MTENPAQAFAAALQELERTRDVDAFVSVAFDRAPQLSRPETGRQVEGVAAATAFWQQYLDQFDDIRSEFDRIVDGEVAVLEWTGRGHLRGGAEIEYRGVSLLDTNDDGRVRRFATYYDTAAFVLR